MGLRDRYTPVAGLHYSIVVEGRRSSRTDNNNRADTSKDNPNPSPNQRTRSRPRRACYRGHDDGYCGRAHCGPRQLDLRESRRWEPREEPREGAPRKRRWEHRGKSRLEHRENPHWSTTKSSRRSTAHTTKSTSTTAAAATLCVGRSRQQEQPTSCHNETSSNLHPNPSLACWLRCQLQV